MDDSAPIAAKTITTVPSSQNRMMARAIMSAGVFGTIGAYIGYLLGRHIRNSVAEPTIKWSMGAFWALIAAYSSFKASTIDRGATVPEAVPRSEASPQKIFQLPVEPKIKVPLSLVEVDTLKDQGQLQEVPELQRV